MTQKWYAFSVPKWISCSQVSPVIAVPKSTISENSYWGEFDPLSVD